MDPIVTPIVVAAVVITTTLGAATAVQQTAVMSNAIASSTHVIYVDPTIQKAEAAMQREAADLALMQRLGSVERAVEMAQEKAKSDYERYLREQSEKNAKDRGIKLK